MRHLEAWQIAGQICDMLGESDINTTARQHEKMANILTKYGDKIWDAHTQEWRDPETHRPVHNPAKPEGLQAHVIWKDGEPVDG